MHSGVVTPILSIYEKMGTNITFQFHIAYKDTLSVNLAYSTALKFVYKPNL